MKRIFAALLCMAMLFSFSLTVYADGDANIDGGGGDMGSGNSQNIWDGRDGVRITIVRDADNMPVSASVDFSNYRNSDVAIHFGKVNKISYCNGSSLTLHNGNYHCYTPVNPIPRIISGSVVTASIEEVRAYFCREGTIRDIADVMGFSYEDLTGGEYKILLEPMAYFKYGGIIYAMTATEAAVYNKQAGNDLRSKMLSLTHKNLPLSMFLETADLGFPAWNGSTTELQNDDTILAKLGLGVVRFSEPDPPPVPNSDVVYRCDTDVITSVLLTTGTQKTPESPAYATFSINGRTYSHTSIYIPEGGSQLAWVKWHTPSVPGSVTITIQSNCSTSTSQITAQVVDLNENPPPDPQANDRNDGFSIPSAPSTVGSASLTWGEWKCHWQTDWVWYSNVDEDGVDHGYWCDHGWWDYDWISYSASLTAAFITTPDVKNPTASGKTMKSGYGINANVSAHITSIAPGSQITGAQNVVAYFPEFGYTTYWRLLKRLNTGYSSTFEFRANPYSTYGRPSHFTPVWFPDGQYVTYVEVMDAWTPAGMLQVSRTDALTVNGSLFDDWHIRPIE